MFEWDVPQKWQAALQVNPVQGLLRGHEEGLVVQETHLANVEEVLSHPEAPRHLERGRVDDTDRRLLATRVPRLRGVHQLPAPPGRLVVAVGADEVRRAA